MNDVNNMTEKVARAICRAEMIAPDQEQWCGPERLIEIVEENWEEYVPAARAAIAAMREPTPDMIREGDYFIGHSESVAGHVWGAMIGAALKE